MTGLKNIRHAPRLRSASQLVSLAVTLVGSLGLVGWALDIAVLKSVSPRWVTMKANSAAAFLLAGASVAILGHARGGRPLRRLSQAAAGLVALIGFFTLTQYLTGWDLGIDQLIFAEGPNAVHTVAPGRMASTTALNFLLVGAALLLLDEPRGFPVAQRLILTAGFIGMLNLLGYAYAVPAIYQIPPATAMAIHTAAAFVLLAVGILCARPERGLVAILTGPSVRGAMARLLPTAIGGALLLGLLRAIMERTARFEVETEAVLFTLAGAVILGGLVWWTASLLSRLDAQRRGAEEQLDQAYLAFEGEVEARTADLVATTHSLRKALTEREQADEALRRSEELYRLLFERNPDPMWVTDRESLTFLAVNEAAIRHYGYSRDEFLAMTAKHIRPPGDVPKLLEYFTKEVNGQPAVATPVSAGLWRHRKKDGTPIDMEITWTPTRFHGRDANFVVAHDVTERARAEQTLQQLYREADRRREEAEAFATLIKDLATSLDLDKVLARLVDQATVLGQADLAFLALVEADGQALSIRAHTGAVSSLLSGLMLPSGGGIAGQALGAGAPRVADGDRDALQGPLFSHNFDPVVRAEGIVAQVAVPILHGGKPLGVLLAARRAARPFTVTEVQILTRLANAASLACHHALLYEQAKKRTATLELLYRVEQALSRPLALRETLDQTVQAAREFLGVEHSVVNLWDEATQRLTAAARAGGEDPRLPQEFRVGEGVHGTVAATRKPLIVNDYQTFPKRVPELANIITATMAVPLLMEDRLVGTLGVYVTQPGRRFTEEDLHLLELLASPAAVAVEKARLHDAAVRRSEELAALLRATQTVMAGLDLNATLGRIVEEAARIAKVPYVGAFLVDPGARVLRPGATAGYTVPPGFEIPLGTSYSGTVASTGEPLAVPAPLDEPRKILTNAERGFDFVSYLGLPIKGRGEVAGVLAFYSPVRRQYSPDDLTYLTSFAAQAAIALENARLFEQVRAGRERLRALSRRLVEVQEVKSRELARELHDEIGQLLTGLKLTLETSTRVPVSESKASLGKAHALVDDLLTRVRELSLDLRPAMLDDFGLLPAVLSQLERYTAQTRVRVAFKHTGVEGRRFPPEVETAAYRVIQEALTNVARHARVGDATIRLWLDANVLGVQIEDRGGGFDAEAALARHTSSGLAGMRERAALLGGQLGVESAPGAGTRVTAELPLREPVERRMGGRRV